MRNLKRALSLTLASVMLLGMMVVGSSAAGYSDVTEEENIEAIEVLQAVGVMSGVDEENFNPDGYVTREQMAVIMSKLLNLDYAYYQGTNPFSDVPAWAAPYVAACAANGITSGIGNGMYGAGQNVNAVQAALMMLKALGYFQYQQDFGDDYVLATVRQATEVGLFDQIDSTANAALTRNEVAQMALNALKSDLVRFTGDPGVEYTGSNGESWIGGYKAEYTPRTSTDPKYDRLIDNKHSSDIDRTGQYYVQLGEELYNGDLVQRNDSDIFERPSYTWTYKTVLIGTYVAKDKLLETYTAGVSGRTLYDLLNNITIREYALEVYVDGHPANNNATTYTQYRTGYTGAGEEIDRDDLVRSNTDSVGATGRGVQTEVYLDRTNKIITITSIHTWLAQGTNTYSESKETASMRVFASSADGNSKIVSVDDVPEVTEVAADDWYLVQMSDKDTVNLEVARIMEPEVLSDSTVTKFTTGNKGDNGRVTKLTTDGTEYSNNVTSIYDDEVLDYYDASLLTDTTYNVYLDQYGNFIGVDIYDGNKAYVFITGYDMGNSNLSVKTATANGIFLDGTMKTMTVNVTDTNKAIDRLNSLSAYYEQWGDNGQDGNHLLNRWYTYTTNEAGTYTLKPVADITAKNSSNVATAVTTRMIATRVDSGDPSLTINCSTNVRLDGLSGANSLTNASDVAHGYGNSPAVGKAYRTTGNPAAQRAYGEDASVYITADIGDVTPRGKTLLNAVGEVTGVYTGVQNIELVVEYDDREGTINEIPESIYTVFDKDNFIIGSIVLGTAKGTVANYAYITNAVKSEQKIGDTYYWEFECIQGGEKKVLTAKSKFQSTVETLKDLELAQAVAELRLDSDGYVVEVKEVSKAVTPADVYANADMKVDIDDESVYIANLLDANSNGLVDAVIGGTSPSSPSGANTLTAELKLSGRTLYVIQGQIDKGLTFSSSAKAVVIQDEKGDDDVITEFNSVRDALNHLADYNYDGADAHATPEVLEYDGIIVAVLNAQGVAEWVVFKSETELVAGSNRPSTSDPAGAMYVQYQVSYDGATYNNFGGETLVSVPANAKDGDPITVYAPTIPGYTPTPKSRVVPYKAGLVSSPVQFTYTARALDHIVITNPTTPVEVAYNGTLAKNDATGLVVEAYYDNDEHAPVTNSANTTFTAGNTTLTGGGVAGTPGSASVTVQYVEGGVTKTATATIPYVNYALISAEITPTGAATTLLNGWDFVLNTPDTADAATTNVKVLPGASFKVTATQATAAAFTSASFDTTAVTVTTATATSAAATVKTPGVADVSPGDGTLAVVEITFTVSTISDPAISAIAVSLTHS